MNVRAKLAPTPACRRNRCRAPARTAAARPGSPDAADAAGMTNRRLRCSLCNCGAVHSVESATKDTTSTIAAVQLNSHTGIGRSALPTIPWAEATSGTCQRRDAKAAEHGRQQTARSDHARASLCHECPLQARSRPPLPVVGSILMRPSLAASTAFAALTQLGPLAILGLPTPSACARSGPAGHPFRAGARPASTAASSRSASRSPRSAATARNC